jgi:N-methylhydantoinase B
LVAAGTPNEGLLGVVASNTRQPREVTGNLRSGAAAMTRGAGKIGAIVDRFSLATYRAAVDQLLDAAEHEARELLDAIPDGEYGASELVELPDGAAAVPIQCLVRVEGSDITVDVTGSAPEQPCSLNVPLPMTISACRLALKRLTTQDTITANSGEHRMLTVVAPEGCILNARPPAGCFMMAQAASLLGEMVVNVISPVMMPSRRVGQTGGNTTGFLGWMPNGPRGRPTEVDDLAAIGYGATPDQDGMNALIYHSLSGMEVASGEVIETRANVSKRRLELVTDSGGPGRRRGGLGTRTEWQVHDYITLQVQAQKTENVGGLGLDGGGPARGSNDVVLDPGTANERALGMTADIQAPAGITIVMNGAGGGGYGDPMEREIDAVEDDVLDGYVSIEAAADHYGVVISARTGRVDHEATSALRQAAGNNETGEEPEDGSGEVRKFDGPIATERERKQ